MTHFSKVLNAPHFLACLILGLFSCGYETEYTLRHHIQDIQDKEIVLNQIDVSDRNNPILYQDTYSIKILDFISDSKLLLVDINANKKYTEPGLDGLEVTNYFSDNLEGFQRNLEPADSTTVISIDGINYEIDSINLAKSTINYSSFPHKM